MVAWLEAWRAPLPLLLKVTSWKIAETVPPEPETWIPPEGVARLPTTLTPTMMNVVAAPAYPLGWQE